MSLRRFLLTSLHSQIFRSLVSPYLRSIWLLSVFVLGGVPLASAQIAPDDEFLFREDSDLEQERLEKQRESLMQGASKKSSENLDFSAPSVSFDQKENVISGEGGVIVSGQGYRMQGERGSVDLDTNDISLQERVLLTGDNTSIQSETLEFNLESEAGRFEDARFTLEEGAFAFESEEVQKLNDVDFQLSECFLSTCACPDGETPWRLRASSATAEREGYAHAYNAVFRFKGVPVLYTPWIAFPIKQERSSGLLVPEFGYSNQNGALLKLPIYTVLDGSTDMTFAPFVQTETRYGLQYDYRERYSRRSSIDSRFVYSNETPRDGDLRGTDITNIAEPSIDDDRFGIYAKQQWSNSPVADVPLSMVSDIHWVSDTLFLREIEDSDIGLRSSRYATSRVALRSQFGENVSSSLVGEWNKALISPQDTTLQRLPELTVNAGRSFRPFGFNPYGLKVTPKLQLSSVRFDRDEGFDGFRHNISPSLKVPFHYKNYFNSDLNFAYHHTMYNLDETMDPTGTYELDDSNDRGIWSLSYEVRTAIERVFELPQQNLLTSITSLGSRNQTHRLRRVKHTIEPKVNFTYVPEKNQEELPLFDSFDRFRKKSLVTYQLLTRLLGSFDYLQGGNTDIEEFTTDIDNFDTLDTLSPLTDFDTGGALPGTNFAAPLTPPGRSGKQIRQLASFRLIQSYDYVEDKEDLDADRRAFSDLGAQLYLTPTQDFGFGAATNYGVEDQDVSSWSLSSHLYDDRGDSIRARYTYVDENISQAEGNIEIVLGPQMKIGYYARFDEQESEFIEQQAALRFSSSCDCWHMDIGFSEQLNPDRERILFRFTLKGLGDVTQNFGFAEDRDEEPL
jgi:LPS-assembly protein